MRVAALQRIVCVASFVALVRKSVYTSKLAAVACAGPSRIPSPQQRGGGAVLHGPPPPVAPHVDSLLQGGAGGRPVAGTVRSKACVAAVGGGGGRAGRGGVRRLQGRLRGAGCASRAAHRGGHDQASVPAPLPIGRRLPAARSRPALPAENFARNFSSTARVMTMSGCSAAAVPQECEGQGGGGASRASGWAGSAEHAGSVASYAWAGAQSATEGMRHTALGCSCATPSYLPNRL